MRQYNHKLVIAYDGTHYHGWQIQPNGISIQEMIQKAIAMVIREEITLIGSGRTDAGVHALGQTAHFKSEGKIDVSRLKHSLNGILPKDIRILDLEEAPLDFHAQMSAISKTYHYHLHLDPIQDPFKRFYSYHLLEKIDLKLMEEAAKHFVGTHDFKSFANEAHSGSASRNSVRTIQRLDLIPVPGGVLLEFQADSFLYKMVRNIVGTLIDVGAGKFQPNEILSMLDAKDRRQAGRAAPPHGLFLVQVFYKPNIAALNEGK